MGCWWLCGGEGEACVHLPQSYPFPEPTHSQTVLSVVVGTSRVAQGLAPSPELQQTAELPLWGAPFMGLGTSAASPGISVQAPGGSLSPSQR